MVALLGYRGGPACLEPQGAQIVSAFGEQRSLLDFGAG